ncbi:hypothetical protein BURKHO8Y_240136 [Burkholderia sp. 8Y]|nr:hypothetical protein BURKHO8Y_240136 [Burkholderia sp. 8Y]
MDNLLDVYGHSTQTLRAVLSIPLKRSRAHFILTAACTRSIHSENKKAAEESPQAAYVGHPSKHDDAR